MIDRNRTYIGVVEDNNDPKRLGRLKIRVLDIFDDIDIDDIPWASPWKDISGEEFSVPENGKVVTVVFDSGDIKTPEYIYSEHYNVNLEKKLADLSDKDYISMKSLIFDHKTQVYVNDSEGLKLDHKFNLLNIKDKSIDICLKDNFGKVNIGSSNSDQRSILGDNFMNWFDKFIDTLMNGSHLGNMGAPIVSMPSFIKVCMEYKSTRDTKLLSNNVYMVDNNKVNKLDRVADGQIGDVWNSTVVENNITSKELIDYRPIDGSFDSTFEVDESGNLVSGRPLSDNFQSNDNTINILIRIIEEKGYNLYNRENELNIIAIRNQCVNIGDKYTDQFVDYLYVLYRNDNKWLYKRYSISTLPGLKFVITETWLKEKNLNWYDKLGLSVYMKDYISNIGDMGDDEFKKGLKILAPSQYIDTYYINSYKGKKSMSVISGARQYVWRDNDVINIDEFRPNNISDPELIINNSLTNNGLDIHRGFPGGKSVGNWSEGSQTFSNEIEMDDFFNLCDLHRNLYGNKFTYTLVTKDDWNIVERKVELDKLGENPFISNDAENIHEDNIQDMQNSNISSSSIVVLNPTSDILRSVNGVISIDRSNIEYVVTGVLSGLPNGDIGPLISRTISRDESSILSDMLSRLELLVKSEYNISIKLIFS